MKVFKWFLVIYFAIALYTSFEKGLMRLWSFIAPPAAAGERLDIYNSRGERQGSIRPSPYTERCCEIYNNRGERVGVVRPSPYVTSPVTPSKERRDANKRN